MLVDRDNMRFTRQIVGIVVGKKPGSTDASQEAVTFLVTIKNLLEDPARLLLEI